MNIKEFGQTIKQKYPQYKDVPDEELGQKMLDKYPQYQNRITSTETTTQTSQPSTPTVGENLWGTVKQLTGFGPEGVLTNYAKDVSAGAAMMSKDGKALQKSQQSTLEMAERARQRAKTVTDPEQKKRLLQVSGEANKVVGEGAQEQAGQFSEDVNKLYWQRGLGVGAQIATTADIINFLSGSPAVGSLKASPSIIKRTTNLIKSAKDLLHPLKNTGKKLELLREGTEVSTDAIEGGTLKGGVLENVYKNDSYLTAGGKFQRKVTDAATRFLRSIGPWETTGEGAALKAGAPKVTNLKEVYGKLNSMKANTDPKVYNILSKAVREFADPLQSKQALRLAKVYSMLKPFEKTGKKGIEQGVRWSIATALAGTIGGLTWKKFSK
ncbi:hypothetical protein M0R04_10260 [Candidatus Dojkabacteria bacterium]|jgi:hypothetical protein|nr:hypothetical protein [Candidatus Dojkabacteria bacterium]